MVINQKFLGKEYPTTSFQIGYEKVREFLIATKGDLEKYSDIAPPTFPVVFQHELLGAVLFDPELKLNLAKLVHGEQEFIYHKPVKVGDTITTSGKIDKIFQKGPHDFVVFTTSSHNQVNEKVCDTIWTFVIRGGNDKDFSLMEKAMMSVVGLLPACPFEAKKRNKALAALSKKAGKSIDLQAAKQDLVHYESLDDTSSQMSVFIDKYMPQVYAGASGDFNIIHLDEKFGKSVGLGGYILHGMATMALGANFATYNIDPRNIVKYKTRFSGVVKPMETLSYSGSWEGKEFQFSAKNHQGQEVLSAAVLEIA